MVNRGFFMRAVLRAGTALPALAALGVGGGAIMLGAPAAAQDFTQVNATGKVQGTDGKAIVGASVTVTSNAQGFSRTVTTDGDGSYRVSALPQGSYTFTISADGYESFTDKAVVLRQGNAANEFALSPAGEATGDVVVTAGRIRVSDFDRNTVGAVIPIGELATRVPVQRDLTSVVLLAPGTAAGDTAFGNLPAVAGSSVSENVFFINGLNITELRKGLGSVTVPFEFYDTIETKVGAISAEFGRFSGAFVNATTKSGGNDFHGGLLFNYEPNALRETRPNTLYDFNRTDYRDSKQTNIYLSGPIIKDHLFFYGLYQSNDTRTGDTYLNSNPNTVIPVFNQSGVQTGTQTIVPFSTGNVRTTTRTSSPFFGGKIDAVIVDGQRLEFTYFNTKQTRYDDNFAVVDANGGTYDSRTDPAGAFTGPYRATSVILSGGENYVARYTGQFTKWFTLSAAYGRNKNRDIVTPSNTVLPSVSDSSGQFTPALIGNPANVINENSDTRTFYRADADIFVNVLGSHHFRGGYDREELTSVAVTRYTGNVAWNYQFSGASGTDYAPPNTLYVSGRTFVNGGTFNTLNEAFYLQDSWSLFQDRLNFNLGVRNDRFSNNNVANETYYKSGNQWAPRLNFSFDPVGDRRTKIFGFYGRYYLPVPTNTNIRLAGAELDYTRYFRVAGVGANNVPVLGAPLNFATAQPCPDTQVRNCELISDGNPTPTAATVSQNLKPQSRDEFILGYEQRLGDRWKVSAFGTYRKLNESLEDVAIDAAVLNYCQQQNIAGCGSIWTGFHQYVLVNPGSAGRITLSDPVNGETSLRTVDFTAAQLGYPKARSEYKAVTLAVEREFDGVWSLNANYTYAKNIGNIEGGIRSDNGQSDSGLTTAFDQPGLTLGTYGYLPTDIRHNLKVFGSYKIADWFTLGANVIAQSPRHYGCIGRVPSRIDRFAGAYGAAGFFCNVVNGQIVTDPAAGSGTPSQSNLRLTPRGSVFAGDWLTQTNLTMAFTLPAELYKATVRVDVFNLFAEKSRIDFQENGTQNNGNPRGDYRYPSNYQAPRSIRLQLGFDF